jgi:hypothetical protein
MLERPLADLVREAVAGDIADVIEDDRGVFAWRWPEHAADLLEVQAERLGGSEQDGDASGWDVESL